VILFLGIFINGCRTQIGEGDRIWNEFVAPHRKVMDMGNYKMHYINIGQGEPVVMVHGFADSTYSWHENIKTLLEAGFRVIFVDQPGHGRTEMPPEPYIYFIENQASEILKLTNALQLERFNLVGQSLGGVITLYISFNYPQKLQKAIVINPPVFGPPHRLALTYPGMAYLASAFAGRWTLKFNLKSVYYDDNKVDDILIDEYTRPTQKPGFWKMLSSLSNQCFSSEFDRMSKNYHQTSMPLLIIWGEQDEWIPLEIASRLHEEIINSRLVTLRNCGHNSHQECSDRVNPIILEFLKTIEQ